MSFKKKLVFKKIFFAVIEAFGIFFLLGFTRGTELKLRSGNVIKAELLENKIAEADGKYYENLKVNLELLDEVTIDFSSKQLVSFLLVKLGETGDYGAVLANNSLKKLVGLIKNGNEKSQEIIDLFVKFHFPSLFKKAKDFESSRVQIDTDKFDFSPYDKEWINVEETMENIETKFDVLARKSLLPKTENMIHEVDLAFFSHGVPDRRITLSRKNEPIVPGPQGEKVFAVGYKGALQFPGLLSNGKEVRFYGLIFPKGFIHHFGADLRFSGPNGKAEDVPSGEVFAQKIAVHQKVFVIRNESSNIETGGQVHIQLGDIFSYMKIDGKTISQSQWIREHVLAVVEFDATGKVLQYRWLDENL